MRFLQPVGFLHNNGNGNTTTTNPSSLTTNGNHQKISTLSSIPNHNNLLRSSNNGITTTTTTTYFDDDNPNVTITSDIVTFTKNTVNQNHTENFDYQNRETINNLNNKAFSNIHILNLRTEDLTNASLSLNDNDINFSRHPRCLVLDTNLQVDTSNQVSRNEFIT